MTSPLNVAKIRTVVEPERELPLAGAWDVLVVGAGMAGVAAGIAAARNGASVCLLEKSCQVGGLATAGNVTVWLPLCDGMGHQVIGGLPEELLNLSVEELHRDDPAAGLSGIPEAWRTKAPLKARRESRYRVGFNPVTYMLALEKMLQAEGVQLLYDTRVCALDREENGDGIRHVIIENKSGRSALAGRVVIDASGDADVCFLAGEPTESLDSNVACGWYYTVQQGRLRVHKMSSRYSPRGDRDAAQGPFFRGDDAESVTGQILASRKRIRRELAGMRARMPGSECYPVNVPAMACLRMTRRLAGGFSLGERHMHHWFEDTVGLTGDWRKPGPVYAIPWRILHGERNRNLLVAGRCISVDRTAWDVTRAIPTCALTGMVTGVAAAMARGDGACDLPGMDPERLRKSLREQGGLLDRARVETPSAP